MNDTPANAGTPHGVSVIVCSRNRADSATVTVASLLRIDDVGLRVYLVDQSTDEATRTALAEFDDERFLYIRSTTTGKGAAINEGFALVDTEFVAFTDDDCEVTPGWVSGIVQPMRHNAAVGLVFSNVVAPRHDTEKGYVPAFERSEQRTLTRMHQVMSGWGLGAAMAARTEALRSLGGVDEQLGPGSRYPSADDLDLELRFLGAGWHVCETPHAEVIHYGFRTWAEGRDHAVRDWQGIGGSIAKGVRGRRPSFLLIGMFIVARHAMLPVLDDVIHLRRPRLRRLTGFLGAFFDGARRPVDRRTMRYEQRSVERS